MRSLDNMYQLCAPHENVSALSEYGGKVSHDGLVALRAHETRLELRTILVAWEVGYVARECHEKCGLFWWPKFLQTIDLSPGWQ